MTAYNIVIDGSLLPGFEMDKVRADFARLIGQTEEQAAVLLTGQPVTLRRNVEKVAADEYVAAIQRVGLAVRAEPAEVMQVDPAALLPTAAAVAPMPAALASDEPIRFEFVGSAFGLFGRSLAAIFASIFVIPTPWVTAWLYRWTFDNIRTSNATRIAFSGTGEQIWLPLMALAALSWVNQIAAWLPLLTIVLQCYLVILLIRWVCANVTVTPGSGGKLSFTGPWLNYLGWYLLMLVSIVTVVGWAWVARAMMRWLCHNIRGRAHMLEFHGTGLEILWRCVAFILSCLLIIPIPWTSRWLLRWYVSQVSVERLDPNAPAW